MKSLVWVVNIPMRAVRERFGLSLGGSGFWLDALANEIVRLYDIRLTVISCSTAYHDDSTFECDGVTYTQIAIGHLAVLPPVRRKILARLTRAICSVEPDFVDFHGSEYGWGEIAGAIGAPSVTTLQGVMADFSRFTFGSEGKWTFLRRLDFSLRGFKQMLRDFWGVLQLGPRVRAELRQFRAARYFLGRTDYDKALAHRLQPKLMGYYSAARVLRPAFYSTVWNSDYHGTHVIFRCGRLAPDKGVELLIQALPLVSSRVPGVRLRIGGAERPTAGWSLELVRLAQELGVDDRVEYCGYLKEQAVAAELSHCSVFALPSYNENSPNTLAEAMIMGVPTVSSNVGGVSSMVEHGYNGLLFERGAYRELANHLISVLSDREHALSLGRAARETALRRHDPRAVAQNTLNAYNDILAAEGKDSGFLSKVDA